MYEVTPPYHQYYTSKDNDRLFRIEAFLGPDSRIRQDRRGKAASCPRSTIPIDFSIVRCSKAAVRSRYKKLEDQVNVLHNYDEGLSLLD